MFVITAHADIDEKKNLNWKTQKHDASRPAKSRLSILMDRQRLFMLIHGMWTTLSNEHALQHRLYTTVQSVRSHEMGIIGLAAAGQPSR